MKDKPTPIDCLLAELLTSGKDEKSTVKKDDYDNIDARIKEETYRSAKLANDAIEGQNKGDAQDRQQRKEFADKIFTFVSLYMFCVFLLLFLSGGANHFHLSDAVLMTLLGTTTANVIGILIIVVTYLFNKKKK